ncbi:MAG: dephospho-CoA kinase [Acidobacteria bacterium]|nr:dephospho-CoA kinase [Acidobacteriota bacterium]
MISAGLTGGIGCGKSTVAALFGALGAVTLNSDEIGRRMMQPGHVVYDRIVSGFGPEVVDAKGQLDRAKLADIVFNDMEKLKHLNAIVHAPVLREIDRQIQLTRQTNPDAVILVESAVLFEAGQTRRFDKMIVVWCTPEQQMQRCLVNFKIPAEAIQRRMAAQIPPDEKKRRADYVIDTSTPLIETEQQVREVYGALQELAAAHSKSVR